MYILYRHACKSKHALFDSQWACLQDENTWTAAWQRWDSCQSQHYCQTFDITLLHCSKISSGVHLGKRKNERAKLPRQEIAIIAVLGKTVRCCPSILSRRGRRTTTGRLNVVLHAILSLLNTFFYICCGSERYAVNFKMYSGACSYLARVSLCGRTIFHFEEFVQEHFFFFFYLCVSIIIRFQLFYPIFPCWKIETIMQTENAKKNRPKALFFMETPFNPLKSRRTWGAH